MYIINISLPLRLTQNVIKVDRPQPHSQHNKETSCVVVLPGRFSFFFFFHVVTCAVFMYVVYIYIFISLPYGE